MTSTTEQRSRFNSPRPNIIVIMSDGLVYTNVGFNAWKDIPTPNIDRIAKQGVIF